MPREIYADEIERFLETLDGVSSARVLTDSGGDISYVYVTTQDALDSRRVRHGVVAALQSRFGIPIDDWRVRLTQLRAGLQASEIPRFRVIRVEETATPTEFFVTVKLGWARGADVRSATGQARGRGGAPGRGRALAAATIAAVRSALEVPSADLALDRVGVVTFLDRPVVLVAVSTVDAGGEARTFIGAAFDEAAPAGGGWSPDEDVDPTVVAALDAVTRCLLHGAFGSRSGRTAPERRERLEAMRHFVLDAAAEAPAPASPAGDLRPAPRAGTAPSAASTYTLPQRRLSAGSNGQERADRAPDPGASGGGASAGAQTTPPAQRARQGSMGETEGVTAMSVQQHDTEAAAGMRAARAPGVEDAFYRSLVAERTPVHLRCRDGYEVARAIVRDAGTYALLVETADGLELFFKHAIISIRILPKPAAQA